jgi:hypothetical protein
MSSPSQFITIFGFYKLRCGPTNAESSGRWQRKRSALPAYRSLERNDNSTTLSLTPVEPLNAATRFDGIAIMSSGNDYKEDLKKFQKKLLEKPWSMDIKVGDRFPGSQWVPLIGASDDIDWLYATRSLLDENIVLIPTDSSPHGNVKVRALNVKIACKKRGDLCDVLALLKGNYDDPTLVKGNVVPLKIVKRRGKNASSRLLLAFCSERSNSLKNLVDTITATLGLVTTMSEPYIMALRTVSSDHEEAPTLVEANGKRPATPLDDGFPAKKARVQAPSLSAATKGDLLDPILRERLQAYVEQRDQVDIQRANLTARIDLIERLLDTPSV